MPSRLTLQELFYQGRHREVLARTVDSRAGTVDPVDSCYVVGALSFLGRLPEAEWLLDFRVPSDPARRAEAEFYLGVGLCRHSRYAEARERFARLLRGHGRGECERARYFAFQGVAFFRFFCARFPRAIHWADKAYLLATGLGFLYGKFLSSDLTGHARLQFGESSAGLKRLEEAGEYARLLGDGGVFRANQVALVCYRTELGLEEQPQALREQLNQVKDQDTYTRSTLLLELGHQQTLRGNFEQARTTLNEACRVIHSVGHRRHGVLLKLHYAYISLLEEDFHQALVLASAARRELDRTGDQPLELKALGLEMRLKERLDLPPGSEDVQRMSQLVARTGLGRGKRQWMRSRGRPVLTPGEDPLGDLLDALRPEDSDTWLPLLERGYLGLVLPHLPGTGKRIVLGITPTGLAVVGPRQCFWRGRGMTDILCRVLATLHGGPRDKDELVREVWDYTYDPLRHDSLVYSTMSRLRQALQPFGDWLEVSPEGYALAPDVEILNLRRETPVRRDSSPELPEGLNSRQGQALRWLRDEETICVRDYQERFDVSRITASRDLNEMARRDLLVRMGRGKATRYSLAGSPPD